MKRAAGAAAVLPVLGQQHAHHAADTPSGGGAYKAKWATAEEMRQIAAICDVILPRTDSPGASDAKVHEYIDYTLASSKGQQQALREGLKWFNAIPAAERVKALRTASEKPETREGRFFKQIKELTIDGYYSSKEGLQQELGWSGLTYLPKFDGCTHPEHKG